MRVAFPTDEDRGLDSHVYGHFGSAPAYIIVESDSHAIETVNNRDRHHAHGQCQPLAALGGEAVDAVVVGGIGAGALERFNAAGIQVFRGVEGTVADNLALAEAQKLPAMTRDQTCLGHHHDEEGCSHHHDGKGGSH